MNVALWYILNFGQLFHTDEACPICEGIDQ
jgi:hypothetical protein